MAKHDYVGVNVNDVAKQLTMDVKITGEKVFAMRLSVGLFFIRLGAKIMGVGIKISDETNAA